MILKIIPARVGQAFLALTLGACMGCPPKPAPKDAGPELLEDGGLATTRADLLGAAGTCSLRAVTQFRTQVDALVAQPSKATWKQAMASWQRVEMMQFGPTASSTAPGGLDLRDQIYSWPLPSRCPVEETLLNKRYETGVGTLLVNRRGLGALEFLLFHEGTDFTCAAAGLQALTPAELALRKQAYAAAIAADLKVHADALVGAWEGGFIETLRTAGPGNPTYMTTAAAMNRVGQSLFYIETQMKDLKLAPAIGLRDCLTPPCLESLESQFASHNTANLRENLVGFRQLLEGCEPGYAGVGFDDLLMAARASSLSSRLTERTAAAQLALEAIEEPDVREALIADPASVRAFYDALKAITDLLKSEFVTVLDVELPMGLEGDND